jgi:hypothetical protein
VHVQALRLTGSLNTVRGKAHYPDGLAAYSEAISLAEAIGMRPDAAYARFERAVLLRRSGRAAEAAREASDAKECFRKLQMQCPIHIPETEPDETNH